MTNRKSLAWLVGAAALALGGAALGGSAWAQENRDIVVSAPDISAGHGRVPTSWFRRIPSLSGPRLSPDGSKMVVRMANQGRAFLAWYDLNDAARTPHFIAAMDEVRDSGDRAIGDYNWVGNDTLVLQYYSYEDFGGGRGNITRLVAYDLAGGNIRQLAWDGAGSNGGTIMHVDHPSGHILVERSALRFERNSTAMGNEVIDIDVHNGNFSFVQRENPEVQSWESDANGVVRFGIGYDRDNGRTRVLYRSNASENFRTVSNAADPSFSGAGLNVLWISPTSDNALVRDNRDGFHKIYRVNLSTLTYSAPVFQTDGYDVDGLVYNFGGRLPVGFAATTARDTVQWTNPRYAEIMSLLEERFGAGNVTIGSRNQDETKLVVFVAAPDQGGSYYLFDTGTGALELIGYRWDHVRDAHMNPVSAFRYTASDGVSIEAIMTMPRHRQQTRGLPLVILTHGGPFGVRDNQGFDGWAQAIAELGYVVVQPNYRGSGGYGKAFQQMGRDNGFGLRMQDDLNDVITHLAGQGLIDANRVCMMGWSYGGYASARAAQRDPDKYRCTIAGAGVYDLPMMRAYDVNYLGNFGSNYLSRGASELSAVSPARNTDGRWAPILIVHGVRDQRVPVAQARTLVANLRGSGKVEGRDYAYIEQAQNTHNLDYDDVQTEWLEGAAGWLERWNPAYIPSDSDRPVNLVPEGPRPVSPRR